VHPLTKPVTPDSWTPSTRPTHRPLDASILKSNNLTAPSESPDETMRLSESGLRKQADVTGPRWAWMEVVEVEEDDRGWVVDTSITFMQPLRVQAKTRLDGAWKHDPRIGDGGCDCEFVVLRARVVRHLGLAGVWTSQNLSVPS
jgi:hypothetical protein